MQINWGKSLYYVIRKRILSCVKRNILLKKLDFSLALSLLLFFFFALITFRPKVHYLVTLLQINIFINLHLAFFQTKM